MELQVLVAVRGVFINVHHCSVFAILKLLCYNSKRTAGYHLLINIIGAIKPVEISYHSQAQKMLQNWQGQTKWLLRSDLKNKAFAIHGAAKYLAQRRLRLSARAH